MWGKGLAKKLLKAEKTNFVHSKQLQTTLIVLYSDIEEALLGIRLGQDTRSCVYWTIHL